MLQLKIKILEKDSRNMKKNNYRLNNKFHCKIMNNNK